MSTPFSTPFPASQYQEDRKCPKCKKTFKCEKTYSKKCCPDCLEARMKNYHKHKVYKLSKEDLKLMEEDKKRKFRELSLKLETSEPDCLKWREQYSKKDKDSAFYVNHINVCRSCGAWVVRHRDALDINNAKGRADEFEELKGYAEAFKPEEPFPEDFAYHPSGARFPMTAICSICGTVLNKKGKCPFCDGTDPNSTE